MTIPQNSGAMGNVLRLQGLKNVSGRKKVLPNFLDELEDVQTDFSGTSSPEPTPQNMPEPDLGGEITSQSYDVRANQVMPPEPQEPPQEENNFVRFGRWLGESIGADKVNPMQKPPIETEQVQMQEGLPPTNAEEEEPGYLSQLGNWIKKGWTPSSEEEIQKQLQRTPDRKSTRLNSSH